jgi:hypothetical protein
VTGVAGQAAIQPVDADVTLTVYLDKLYFAALFSERAFF